MNKVLCFAAEGLLAKYALYCSIFLGSLHSSQGLPKFDVH